MSAGFVAPALPTGAAGEVATNACDKDTQVIQAGSTTCDVSVTPRCHVDGRVTVLVQEAAWLPAADGRYVPDTNRQPV